MPLSGSHGRLSGSGNTLWLKERIAHLRGEILQENPVTISVVRWVNGAKVAVGTYTVRIARSSRGQVESNEQTTDSHLPVVVLTGSDCVMASDYEFTSPSYPATTFRVVLEVMDFNAGDYRRYECEAVR